MIITDDSPLLLDDSDYLEHYGIKGMKWGVRRTIEQLQRARGRKSWEKKTSKNFDKLDKAINESNDIENRITRARNEGRDSDVKNLQRMQVPANQTLNRIMGEDQGYYAYAARRLSNYMKNNNFREIESGKAYITGFTKNFGSGPEHISFVRQPNLKRTRYT